MKLSVSRVTKGKGVESDLRRHKYINYMRTAYVCKTPWTPESPRRPRRLPVKQSTPNDVHWMSERFSYLQDTLKEGRGGRRGTRSSIPKSPNYRVRPQLIVRYRESISENSLLVMFQTFNHNEGSVWQLRFLHKGLKRALISYFPFLFKLMKIKIQCERQSSPCA
jgi:hypothetical protein